MLMSRIVGVGQNHARFEWLGKLEDFLGKVAGRQFSLVNAGTYLSALIPPVLEASDSKIKLYDPLRT
jgi:hypothetical protein